MTNAAVTEISPAGVAYTLKQQLGFLPTRTVVWTGGTEPHPLLKSLPLPAEKRDARGRIQVLPTLQLSDFPEVFMGGDCAYVPNQPQPPTAQVAYQQGKAIADNLVAIETGKLPKPAQVHLRGTLMKLGIGEGTANIFDRFILSGEVGHLIREATYLDLLPTPVYNLKAATEWLTDELFQRHQPRSIHPERANRTPVLAGTTALVASLLVSMPLIWRAAQPMQFQESLTRTGVPALLDRLAPN